MRRARRSARFGAAAALFCLAASLGATAPCCAGSEPERRPAPAGDPSGGGARGPGAGAREAQGFDARRAEVRFPSGRLVEAEIADTPERVQRGYMFRREVREGEGMIFVFPESGFHSFWMKNTLVSLDMIWLDERGLVIHIEASVPPCAADPCPGYGPPRKARHVLEVRGGTTAREGLKVGDRLRISFPQPRR